MLNILCLYYCESELLFVNLYCINISNYYIMKTLFSTCVLFLLSFHFAFSQCSENEETKVLLIGDSWAFFMNVDGTINNVYSDWGHSNVKYYTNLTLSENGAETVDFLTRSEERRVGKECRYRWSTYQ